MCFSILYYSSMIVQYDNIPGSWNHTWGLAPARAGIIHCRILFLLWPPDMFLTLASGYESGLLPPRIWFWLWPPEMILFFGLGSPDTIWLLATYYKDIPIIGRPLLEDYSYIHIITKPDNWLRARMESHPEFMYFNGSFLAYPYDSAGFQQKVMDA